MVGGNAVAAWVARVGIEAVRNTKDVDLLVRREEFERVIDAARSMAFFHQVDLLPSDGSRWELPSGLAYWFSGGE